MMEKTQRGRYYSNHFEEFDSYIYVWIKFLRKGIVFLSEAIKDRQEPKLKIEITRDRNIESYANKNKY